MAEWFKAAVLKTPRREHPVGPEKRQFRRNLPRIGRVRRLFRWNKRHASPHSGGGMQDHSEIPRGHTVESWANELEISRVLNWDDSPPRRVRDVIDVRRPIHSMEDNARRGFVYFIGAKDGPVKIGFAAEPKKRLGTLNVASAVPLSILAVEPGTQKTEREYHIKYKRSRMSGEWFQRTPDLMREIKRIGHAAAQLGGGKDD